METKGKESILPHTLYKQLFLRFLSSVLAAVYQTILLRVANRPGPVDELVRVRGRNGRPLLLLALEVPRWLDPEEVRQRSGDDPGSEVGAAPEAARRIAHERPHVPHRSPPAARHCESEISPFLSLSRSRVSKFYLGQLWKRVEGGGIEMAGLGFPT